jgi:oligosaccharide repeat unit polymerase
MSKIYSSIKINTLKLSLALFLYKVVIELIYVLRISPLYGYTGLRLNIDIISFVISNFYLLILIRLMPKDKRKPSTFLYLIFLLFLTIPTISYYWLNGKSHIYTFFVVLSCVVVSFILKLKRIYIVEDLKYAKIALRLFFIFYVLITFYLVIIRGGIDLRALNFMTIYQIRAETSLPGGLGYLLNWSAKVFSPFFFAYFYYKSNKKGLLIVLILQLLLYLSFGFKAYLFSIGMLILCIYASKNNKFETTFTNSFTGLIFGSILVDILGITGSLRNSLPFRMVFVPAQIQFQYFEFFQNREKMFFADGIIGRLLSVESQFDVPVPYVISSYFHDGAVSNSNTGIFSDAYANGGFINMFLFAVLFGIILYLIDSLSNKVPQNVVVAAFSYIMFVLNDNSLLTALLTGGIGLMMVLLMLFNAQISSKKQLNEKKLSS